MAHRLAYLTTLQPRSVFGGVDYCAVLFRTEKGLGQRLVRYRPNLYVSCIYPRLHSQAVWRPCGAAMGWALATHGPRGYFYALVTQLPTSDLRSTGICVEVTIRSVFGGLGS